MGRIAAIVELNALEAQIAAGLKELEEMVK